MRITTLSGPEGSGGLAERSHDRALLSRGALSLHKPAMAAVFLNSGNSTGPAASPPAASGSSVLLQLQQQRQRYAQTVSGTLGGVPLRRAGPVRRLTCPSSPWAVQARWPRPPSARARNGPPPAKRRGAGRQLLCGFSWRSVGRQLRTGQQLRPARKP